MNTNDLGKSVIFPIGEKFASPHFNGTVSLNMLTPFGSALPIANVSFEPGCRNSWHKHAGGQILLVTGSRGYYQEAFALKKLYCSCTDCSQNKKRG